MGTAGVPRSPFLAPPPANTQDEMDADGYRSVFPRPEAGGPRGAGFGGAREVGAVACSALLSTPGGGIRFQHLTRMILQYFDHLISHV